jgi:release factor H-coupled RctB family protein
MDHGKTDKVWTISPVNKIEGEAIRQLEKAGSLPGMLRAVGLPDLHPGKGAPVGAAFFTDGMVYPYLLGNDVGCGMALWKTSLKSGRFKPEKTQKRLHGLEEPWSGDTGAWLGDYGVKQVSDEYALGTIGLGNHFAELQTLAEILDEDACTSAGIESGSVYLLIHSGSRTKGDLLLRKHVDKYRDAGLDTSFAEGKEYLAQNDECQRWANANRALIAWRVLDLIDAEGSEISDHPHNFVESKTIGGIKGLIHRKGAAPADRGITVIPGSRGSLTYIVQPIVTEESLNSVAHGAGRKWARGECKDRLRDRYSAQSLTRTDLGSLVICEDKDLLFEEAPMAYKNIEHVITEMKDAGLIREIATLKPLITYKVRR